MNAVAFSLYGDGLKYTIGAVRNAWLMQTIYPGWEMHLWYDEAVPDSILERLRGLRVRMHRMNGDHKQKMFYRFLVHDIPGVDRYLIRDCDSRITKREALMVEEWIQSERVCHTMHDHPYHSPVMMGGLWGLWRTHSGIDSMENLIKQQNWSDNNRYGQDQEFLAQVIWPRMKHHVMQHGKEVPIPPDPEDPTAFIGEVLDEENRPNEQHRRMRLEKR